MNFFHKLQISLIWYIFKSKSFLISLPIHLHSALRSCLLTKSYAVYKFIYSLHHLSTPTSHFLLLSFSSFRSSFNFEFWVITFIIFRMPHLIFNKIKIIVLLSHFQPKRWILKIESTTHFWPMGLQLLKRWKNNPSCWRE